MNDPAILCKLTVFSQLLVELNFQTLEAQLKIIKAAGEEDLRIMLLNRYLLKLDEMPVTMTALYGGLKRFCLTSKELLKNNIYIYIYIHTHTQWGM